MMKKQNKQNSHCINVNRLNSPVKYKDCLIGLKKLVNATYKKHS